jgi:hypothetical protein
VSLAPGRPVDPQSFQACWLPSNDLAGTGRRLSLLRQTANGPNGRVGSCSQARAPEPIEDWLTTWVSLGRTGGEQAANPLQPGSTCRHTTTLDVKVRGTITASLLVKQQPCLFSHGSDRSPSSGALVSSRSYFGGVVVASSQELRLLVDRLPPGSVCRPGAWSLPRRRGRSDPTQCVYPPRRR